MLLEIVEKITEVLDQNEKEIAAVSKVGVDVYHLGKFFLNFADFAGKISLNVKV